MTVRILQGDVRERLSDLPDGSVQCVVTSPPYYGLRDYQVAGQLGLGPTLAEYICTMVDVFRGVRRILRDDGVLWLNVGDSMVQKQLQMVPARLAIALQEDGWWLRSEIVWAKPNPMPESVADRPTSAHEKLFLLSKRSTYYFDADAIREPMAASSVARLAQNVESQEGSHRANGGAKTNGTMRAVGGKQRGHERTHEGFNDRWDAMPKDKQQANGANARNVWTIATHGFKDAHFATFPPEIPTRCIKAGSKPGDTILDPFLGSGTTLLVADRLGREGIGIELNPDYAAMAWIVLDSYDTKQATAPHQCGLSDVR